MINVRKEINVEEFSGGLIYWDSGEVPTTSMVDALTAIVKPNLMPDPDSFKAKALDHAVTAFAKKVCPSRRGSPIETIRMDTAKPTFLAQQVMKTKLDAIHTDIVAIELTDGDECKIVKHNSNLLPKLTSHLAQCEAWVQDKYDRKAKKVPANRVTEVLNKLLKIEGCLPMARQGRLFAVPSDATTDMLEVFASHFPDSSPLNISVSPLHLPPTATLFKKIASKCTAEMERMLEEVEEDLQQAGDKQRKNGAKSRYDKCEEVKAYAESFKVTLGDAQTKFFVDAAKKVQDAITTNTVLDILS
jgi:hypothetical protein